MDKQLRGYAVAEADAFLSRCAATPGVLTAVPALSSYPPVGQPVTAEDVERVMFRQAWRGYAMREVDALLDAVVDALSS